MSIHNKDNLEHESNQKHVDIKGDRILILIIQYYRDMKLSLFHLFVLA